MEGSETGCAEVDAKDAIGKVSYQDCKLNIY